MADNTGTQSTGDPGNQTPPPSSTGGTAPTTGNIQVHSQQAAHPNQPFRPLPPPTGKPPYHLSLDDKLPAAQMASIRQAGTLVFHIAGDTGGVQSPQPQQIVAMNMENDVETAGATAKPALFYHLGDVVYYYGEVSNYYAQYYEPYKLYPLPIFAIPGNHDGDLIDDTVPSLAGFVRNFCAASDHTITREAGDVTREAMTQPNVYWTLDAPFVTIIGLYTNVPEGGRLDNDQISWLETELGQAPADKALIVAMHHPIYSADVYHSGSKYMAGLLDQAIQKTGRTPDAVFAGHVHNYQRFTRSSNGRDIPYIVAGAGGYWHLHYMMKNQGAAIQTPYPIPGTDVTLESYCDDRHGFMRLEVSAQTLKGEYIAVPRPHESWRNGPTPTIDSFTLDLKQHRLT